jgi:hypothetical protein
VRQILTGRADGSRVRKPNATGKVWMLTGDKMETAINIGFSCRLLDESMLPLLELNVGDVGRLDGILEAALQEKRKMEESGVARPLAVVLGGPAMTTLFDYDDPDTQVPSPTGTCTQSRRLTSCLSGGAGEVCERGEGCSGRGRVPVLPHPEGGGRTEPLSPGQHPHPWSCRRWWS